MSVRSLAGKNLTVQTAEIKSATATGQQQYGAAFAYAEETQS